MSSSSRCGCVWRLVRKCFYAAIWVGTAVFHEVLCVSTEVTDTRRAFRCASTQRKVSPKRLRTTSGAGDSMLPRFFSVADPVPVHSVYRLFSMISRFTSTTAAMP